MLHHVGISEISLEPQITFCLARARWFSSARLYNLPSFAMLRSVLPAA